MNTVNEKAVVEKIKDLLVTQPLAVLATQGDDGPYTSLMAYAYTDDLRYLVVATAMSTRKHRNIVGESRVALLIDDRSNTGEDFQSAAAVTIVGKASVVEESEREFFDKIYIKRHPSLEGFLLSPDTAFLKVSVHNYLMVSKFQEVVEYQVGIDSVG